MKPIFKYCPLLLIISVIGSCQFNNSEIPLISLQRADQNKIINTHAQSSDKPTLLIYFSPECGHCQDQAIEIARHKEFIANTDIYFISYDSLKAILDFRNKFGLSQFKNIVFGRDINYTFPSVYKVHATPYLAFFDMSRKLRVKSNGFMSINQIEYYAKIH